MMLCDCEPGRGHGTVCGGLAVRARLPAAGAGAGRPGVPSEWRRVSGQHDGPARLGLGQPSGGIRPVGAHCRPKLSGHLVEGAPANESQAVKEGGCHRLGGYGHKEQIQRPCADWQQGNPAQSHGYVIVERINKKYASLMRQNVFWNIIDFDKSFSCALIIIHKKTNHLML